MKRMVLIALSAMLALSALPGVFGQSGGTGVDDGIGDTDEVTFYGHVFGHDLSQPMPANVEPPTGEDNYGLGTFDECTPAGSVTLLQGGIGGVVDPKPGTTCEDSQYHKLALFSTAGFVDVETRSEFQSEGGYGQLHNERGQTKAIQLDKSGTITASVFLTVDYHSWLAGGGDTSCPTAHPENVPCVYPYWGWDVGVQPNFVTEATLYHGNLGSRTNASAAPPVQEALESGKAKVLAQGQWGPGQAMTGLPGTPIAMEFPVELGAPSNETIPKSDDFFLVFDTYSETPAGKVGIHSVRWWGGEFFPPTFTMPVKNAFTVERVVPNFAHGKLALLGIMNTPWGSYDIDSESVDLTITGPDGSTVQTDNLNRFADFSVAHGGHFKPVNITWVWDYQRDSLQPGEYTVTVSAANFQHSAAASCEATFTLEQTNQGRIVPGEAEEGVCGTQSSSQEDIDDLQAQPNEEGN